MSERKTVLVTGGAGFIGSHTVDLLLEHGHRVAVLDDFSTGKRSNLPPTHDRLRVIEGDVSENLHVALAPIEAEWDRIDRIIHLAAQTSVTRSIERPLLDYRVNGLGTLQVLEYARDRKLDKVVFASSAAVYGDAATPPVGEDAPCLPLSPYGVNKLSSEHALRYYAAVHGLETIALRFFNVYGARQDPKSPYSGVISIFLDRAARGDPLAIFGDGMQTRDFVHVSDVARAVVDASSGGPCDGRALNLGTGSSTSVRELAETVRRVLRADTVEIAHAPARPGEILHSLADVSRARDALGFTAKVGIEEGLRRTAEWFLNEPVG